MLQMLAATTNAHKIAEFREILRDLKGRVQLLSPSDYPMFPEIAETGTTFEENSRLKAEQASAFIDTFAIADDSGLMVDALHGAPGIHSARYAGPGASDADRMAKLLRELGDSENRKGRFVCVISLACRGKLVRAFRGEVAGTIALAPRGNRGFGYDPLFVPEGYTETFGELGNEIKDRISHRARALEKFAAFLRTGLNERDELEFR